MDDRTADNRARILETARAVEERLAAVCGRRRTSLNGAARMNRMSAAARADLHWMAELVANIKAGRTPSDRDADAFENAALRVAQAVDELRARSLGARVGRGRRRVIRAAAALGTLAAATFLGVTGMMAYKLVPALPAYPAVMLGSAIAVGVCLAIVTLEAFIVRWGFGRPDRWFVALRPFLRGAIWTFGGILLLPVIAVALLEGAWSLVIFSMAVILGPHLLWRGIVAVTRRDSKSAPARRQPTGYGSDAQLTHLAEALERPGDYRNRLPTWVVWRDIGLDPEVVGGPRNPD